MLSDTMIPKHYNQLKKGVKSVRHIRNSMLYFHWEIMYSLENKLQRIWQKTMLEPLFFFKRFGS